MNRQENFLKKKIENRKKVGTYRSMQINDTKVDFWSNDYLGLAHSQNLRAIIDDNLKKINNGATGSRLISGNSHLHEQVEKDLAVFHNAEAGLLFNSGYDANIGVFSCIAAEGDIIFYDDLVHASIHDGLRLSRAKTVPFKHNDLEDLEHKLSSIENGNIYIATEGIFSMDGDIAPLSAMVKVAEKYNAAIIIDEAHSNGVLGEQGAGLVSSLGLEERIFARIHTFGKAIGVHGAIVLGSTALREYLTNYARSFIFTTAMPPHNVLAIKAAYEYLSAHTFLIKQLKNNIQYFNENAKKAIGKRLIPSPTAIQAVIIEGNDEAKMIAERIKEAGFQVKAILFPTVPKGKERIRICLHAFNTKEEIMNLIEILAIEINNTQKG